MTDLKTRVERASQLNRPGHDYLVNDLWVEILSLREQLATRTADDVKCEEPNVTITAPRSTRFTPGPWLIVHTFNVVGSDGRRGVANTGGYSENRSQERCHEENAANARLIAAAPKMLNLLLWMGRKGGLGHDVHDRINALVIEAVEPPT